VLRAGAGVNTLTSRPPAPGRVREQLSGKNSIAVAELVFALLLAIDRRIRKMPPPARP